MSIALGFLAGSLLILAVVLYFTRIRNSSIPHAGTTDADRDEPRTQTCDICERERVCRTVGDLVVCSACDDDLMA